MVEANEGLVRVVVSCDAVTAEASHVSGTWAGEPRGSDTGLSDVDW